MHDGRVPFNAHFHTEAKLLLRVKEKAGTLIGRTFNAYLEQSMCAHAREHLPLIALELGNPRVTFIGPLGERHTMHNGSLLKADKSTIKRTYFDSRPREGWPSPEELERYFLGPQRRWFESGGNDSASLIAEGLSGTQHLPIHKGRFDVHLYMWGNPDVGVLLLYRSWGVTMHARSAQEVICAGSMKR